MGDVGRFDEQGRLWFLGRKAHRVEVNGEQLLPIPCEAIFNQHPAIKRSALVSARGKAVICVEREAGFGDLPWRELVLALRALAQQQPHTRAITTFLEHPAFPVDIRHNAKIRREVLAQWASQRI
jgi:acyl-coenzyme A synthetase/AMP-(fatty) acid ligase